ncbi:microsomal triglyceride transfer protein large subunit-like isoform X1 [Haliotis rufescens]|uniref:microsomal triglyceride transfer protein large subunit-like isoform X1 n=1 Tax=Haliotis rufescens TaxID=6454 RepID=UPI00201EB8B4|nr:microsomal triglyceride transfer protein large subunit-like isoform X1 [Haliotis rufescens]
MRTTWRPFTSIMNRSHLCLSPALLLVIFTIIQISALKYETGKTYKYSYSTSVLFNDLDSRRETKAQRDTGVQLSLGLDITPLLQEDESQLFKLKLNTATVLSASRESQERTLGTLLKYPVYFELNKDSIGRLFVPETESAFCSNIKKGIISLFQVQEQPGDRTEIDVSGECLVLYTQTSPTQITKTKKECNNLEIAGQFSNPNKILDVTVASKTTLDYEFENGIIKSISGLNTVSSRLNMRSSMNGGATVSQRLTFQGSSASSETVSAADIDTAIPMLEKEIGKSFRLSLLPTESEITQCIENCESPTKILSKVHGDLVADKISTVASAKAFMKMLKSFRNAGKQTIAEVLTSPDSYYTVPQLIDIATASQTSAAQKAMMELLVFAEDYGTEHPERYLLAATYSTHPGEFLIKDLLAILKKPVPNESLKESLLLATGAVIHTFCQVKDQCTHQVVQDFRTLLVEGVAQCTDDACRLTYLRAMGNTGLPDTVSTIMKLAVDSNNSMVSITAVEALRRVPRTLITAEVRASLSLLFHQSVRRYDSSVRVVALDLLLQLDLSLMELRNILLAMADRDHHELSTFIKMKVLDRAQNDENLRSKLQTILKEGRINNYQLMAQVGKSSSFTGYLAKTEDLNCSYNLLFENSNSGVMKRSGMKVNLFGNVEQPFMNIGIYGEALESLMGEEEVPVEGEGEEEPVGPEIAAGLSFSLMDVLLKQYEFFRGMSGLMSAVWSAPSELTSALQGNLLLQDHSQRVHLSNGLILNVEVIGVISIDLSGYVSISLWNRNCESLIKNSGALYVEGNMRLESPDLGAGITYSGEGQSAIDFLSDANFYEMPLTLCLQMKRPDFKFRETVSKYEQIKGLKKYNIRLSKTTSISGESFFLNKANSEECKIMKKAEA